MIKLKVVNRKSTQTMTRRLHSELCFKFEASTKHHFNADHRPITPIDHRHANSVTSLQLDVEKIQDFDCNPVGWSHFCWFTCW